MRHFISNGITKCAVVMVIGFIVLVGDTSGQIKTPAPAFAPRSITVLTEPGAAVWIDGVYFGAADAGGRLVIRSVPAGNRSLRVRLDGFKEAKKPLSAAKGDLAMPLVRTADAAELAYQQAEVLKTSDRQQAIAAYEKAIKLRPSFPEAHLGLARAFAESGKFDRADKAIRALKKIRPRYAEASAVEGRVYKDIDEETKAVATFKRAITEGGGYQPEAYTGLGLLYKEKAENAGSAGDYAEEQANFAESARYLAVAAKQLTVAPDAPVVYQLLGLVYERQQKFEDAIKVYEDFLLLFPDSNEATAVQSFIVQLKKQLNSQQ